LYITPNIVQSEYSNQNINSTLLRLPVYNISAFQLQGAVMSLKQATQKAYCHVVGLLKSNKGKMLQS